MTKIFCIRQLSIIRLVSLLVVYFLISGCATIVKGTTQGIPVTSEPPGADVLVDGMLVGTTPTDVEMKRKRDHLVTIKKDGYETKTVPVLKNIGGAVFGNIIAGGLIGWGVDAASGAQNNLTPKTISVILAPVKEGGSSSASDIDSATAVDKLNQLDQMLENEQISKEEYGKARMEILEKYFPELLPDPEEAETSSTDASEEESEVAEPDSQ